MITEGELIEIAQRRRQLEDAIERTKPHIGAARERAHRELKAIHRETADSDTLTRWQAQEMTRLEKLEEHCEELPHDLDKIAGICRDDMNRMAEEIRKSAETGG